MNNYHHMNIDMKHRQQSLSAQAEKHRLLNPAHKTAPRRRRVLLTVIASVARLSSLLR